MSLQMQLDIRNLQAKQAEHESTISKLVNQIEQLSAKLNKVPLLNKATRRTK